MIDHVSLGSREYRGAVAFYAKALAPLGLTLQRDTGAEAAFGTAAQWSFFVYPVSAQEHPVAPMMHVAFGAPSRSVVEAVHAAALANGASDARKPGLRPDISATYYGAIFLDPDGHKIEVLTNAA